MFKNVSLPLGISSVTCVERVEVAQGFAKLPETLAVGLREIFLIYLLSDVSERSSVTSGATLTECHIPAYTLAVW